MLIDGPGGAAVTVLLAHGAAAPMDHMFMTRMAAALSGQALRVVRFEFDYMAQRRTGGPRRPPPKVEMLCAEYRAMVHALNCDGPLIIGGKSMGGRVATMVANDLFADGVIAGALCLGYPFHPIGKPDRLRITHLQAMSVPVLICQGTRDAFGTREEVAGYALSPQVRLHWLEDGTHDFVPRKSVTGRVQLDLMQDAAQSAGDWVRKIVA